MRFHTVHRYIRALTRHYPSRHLAPQFSTLMGYIFPLQEPMWMVSEPCGLAPLLELNLSHLHQQQDLLLPSGLGELLDDTTLSSLPEAGAGP